MKTKTDISYGVIPFRKNNRSLEVFMIHQYSNIKDNAYWTFPKGHPEGEETPKETATRELLEETGLIVDQFLTDKLFKNEYSFRWQDTLVQKTAAFFLVTVVPGEVSMQAAEVREAAWLPICDAIEQLDYPASKVLLKDALEYLKIPVIVRF